MQHTRPLSIKSKWYVSREPLDLKLRVLKGATWWHTPAQPGDKLLWGPLLDSYATASKLAVLPLPDCIYNWLLNFLSHRRHCTKFSGLISKLTEINASFVQGSVTAPTNLVIDASDLKAITAGNLIPKYADDAYLIVPPQNTHTRSNWSSKAYLRGHLKPTSP